MRSINVAPGFTVSGESRYMARYWSLQTISRPLVSSSTTPCVMLFKVRASNAASASRGLPTIKRLMTPSIVPRASKLRSPAPSYRTSI